MGRFFINRKLRRLSEEDIEKAFSRDLKKNSSDSISNIFYIDCYLRKYYKKNATLFEYRLSQLERSQSDFKIKERHLSYMDFSEMAYPYNLNNLSEIIASFNEYGIRYPSFADTFSCTESQFAFLENAASAFQHEIARQGVLLNPAISSQKYLKMALTLYLEEYEWIRKLYKIKDKEMAVCDHLALKEYSKLQKDVETLKHKKIPEKEKWFWLAEECSRLYNSILSGNNSSELKVVRNA